MLDIYEHGEKNYHYLKYKLFTMYTVELNAHSREVQFNFFIMGLIGNDGYHY